MVFVASPFLGLVNGARGSAESSGVPVTVIVVGLNAGPPRGTSGWTTAREADHHSVGFREDTATGNGLHESRGP